jgi:hypothetical protein
MSSTKTLQMDVPRACLSDLSTTNRTTDDEAGLDQSCLISYAECVRPGERIGHGARHRFRTRDLTSIEYGVFAAPWESWQNGIAVVSRDGLIKLKMFRGSGTDLDDIRHPQELK